ncbi:hypothetical protein UM92_17410 [Bacillus safensis]|nr:hypothetical protein UM92_17410 [Bacillus safensis]
MMQKLKLYFLGYFLYFPLSFFIIYFIWMFMVKADKLFDVFSNSTSVIGIYYIIVSVFFVFLLRSKFKDANRIN